MLIYLQTIETDKDKSKFEQIYDAYRGLMFHVAFKILEQEQDAEDAVHHAFVKIAENLSLMFRKNIALNTVKKNTHITSTSLFGRMEPYLVQ